MAIYQSGQFDVNSIRKEAPDIDIGVMMIPHPEGKETAAILGGWSFVVPKDAKNPEDAKKFIAFMAESENMGFFTDTFPARTSAMSLPRFDDPILTRVQGDAALRPTGCRSTRTGSRSPRPISTACSRSCSATRRRRRRWIRPPRRSQGLLDE